jgi:steroid 5-alpha reductase family enzyme
MGAPMDVDFFAYLALDAALLGSINFALWLVSLPLQKTWPVDFIWSCWPPLQCALILMQPSASEGGVTERQAAIVALTALWGCRLTYNFVARGGIGHEDWRYTDMRRQFGSQFWWVSLFSVFLGQTVFLFAACVSLYGALASPLPVGPLDASASALALFAIALEALSDVQMDHFRLQAAAARRQAQGREGHAAAPVPVLSTGLWGWSRHPNYLGEMLWWWALWLFGCAVAPRWTVCGPVAITALFNLISVDLLETRQLANKGDAYRAYKRQVPSALLLVPPPLGRALGRLLYGPPETAVRRRRGRGSSSPSAASVAG